LYARAGFTPCDPFGDYSPSRASTFMTLTLELDTAYPGCQRPSACRRWRPGESLHPSVISVLGEASSCLGPGLAHPERLSFGDHDDCVMQEPVEQADGGGVLGQEPAPLVEGPVRADAQGTPFVGGGDEPEQQLGAGVVEWREADLVDLCGCPHRSTYADTATMPSTSA
jgi:hypothetical protein